MSLGFAPADEEPGRGVRPAAVAAVFIGLDTAAACGVSDALPRYIPCNEYSAVFETDGGPCPLHVTAVPSLAAPLDVPQMRRITALITRQMMPLRHQRFGMTREVSSAPTLLLLGVAVVDE